MRFSSDLPSNFKAATMPDYGGGNKFDAFAAAFSLPPDEAATLAFF